MANDVETCRFEGPSEDGAIWFHCKCETGEWKMINLGCPDPQAFREAMALYLASRETADEPTA